MKRFSALFLTMVLMFGCVNSVFAAEVYPSHTYQFVVADCTWTDAFLYAKDAGGHLACFETPEEYQYVLNKIEEQGLTWKIFWIGGRRDPSSFEYHWVDSDNNPQGDVLNYSSNWLYYYWLPGEPSFQDQGIAECCMDLFYTTSQGRFVLNDAPNDILSVVPSFSGKIGYIVEYDYVYYPPSAGYDWYYPDSNTNSGNTVSNSSDILPNVPDSFTFSSGVGGWSSDILLNDDGTFIGSYHDSDMGSDTENYPGGVCYISNFTGRFSNFHQIDPYTWTMDLTELNYTQEPGTDFTNGQVHYLVTEAYGLAGGSTFYLYLPGHPVSTLPEEFMNWADMYMGYTYPENLTIYGMFNVDTG